MNASITTINHIDVANKLGALQAVPPLPPPQKKTTKSIKMIDICLQNNIPVFSPALTDGSIGDMIYFHSYKNPGLVIDIVEGKLVGPGISLHCLVVYC